MNESEIHETCHRNGIDYEIYPDPHTGLMTVWANGSKVGQTQTLAGARLIRRNHARRVESDYQPFYPEQTHPY